MLTFIIFCPLLAAISLVFLPRNYGFAARLLALGATFLSMVAALFLFLGFSTGSAGYQYEQIVHWVTSLGISYHVGVDGINVGLVVMGAIVAFAATCASWEVKEREKEFYVLLLVMITGILGAFASLDLFFFYFFHELALIPTFIMIGMWGRGQDKNYAAYNITLYLSLGALIALIGLIALYLQLPADHRSFDIVEITNYFRLKPMAESAQKLIFPLLMFGFGILVSLWPFHTWAPLGYGAAPTPTAMLHAGVLKKFGLYGLIRVALPLLPLGLNGSIFSNTFFEHFPVNLLPSVLKSTLQAMGWLDLLVLLCLGNIVYCALVAIRQKDLNQLIGNSSVAHMGFVFLGIASLNLIGITGAVMVMVAHGLLAALTFGLSGYIFQQTRTLEMEKLGGLMRQMPFIGAALVMAMMAGCGLPGFANFAGEVMVFFGAWKTFTAVTALACWGALILGAVYMLRAIRNVLHGPGSGQWNGVSDANWWRRLPFALLLAALLALGFFPRLLTEKIKPSAEGILKMAVNSTPEKAPPPKKMKRVASAQNVK